MYSYVLIVCIKQKLKKSSGNIGLHCRIFLNINIIHLSDSKYEKIRSVKIVIL